MNAQCDPGRLVRQVNKSCKRRRGTFRPGLPLPACLAGEEVLLPLATVCLTALFFATLSPRNCLAAGDPLPVRLPKGEADLANEAANLTARYVTALDKLAQWCRQRQLQDEARKTAGLGGHDDPYTIRLPVLPRDVGALRPPDAIAGDAAQWHRQLAKLRQDQANALYALAQRCAEGGQPWLGYRLVLDALRANPDHEAARRVLGYVKYQNQWHTPYEIAMLRGGMVWTAKFGWLEKKNVARYERGDRLLGSTWIDAANDAALHADITTGWDIETEHYRIRTNDGIEAAVALGAKLENLNWAWQQIFIGYYATAGDVRSLLAGKRTTVKLPPRMEVVYFHDKQQYQKALKTDISMGLYVPENRTAYFYAGSEDSQRTMYHEATHQLFHQMLHVADGTGAKANCWLIEGVAMYMETIRREGDCFVLGGLNDIRLQAARYHLAKGDFFVPFERLVRLGVRDVQSHPQIAKLYSQIAAMTSFLVHYDGGRYRHALVSCLAAIYDGSQDPQLLARAAGTSYAELDKQYREYMRIQEK